MRRNVLQVLAALAGLLLTGPVYAVETSYSPVAYEDGGYVSNEVAGLRSEVEQLRSQLDTSTTTAYDGDKKAAPAGCGGCGSCCNNGCDDCCNCGGTCGCFEPYCHASGLWAEAEVTFFRYHRADGVRVGDEYGEDVEFDFEVSPRLTLGYVGCDGLGARVRYWSYDHQAEAKEYDSFLDVDTWLLDFEVFDTFCLNRNWSLEVAAGIRYNDFTETMLDCGDDPDELRFNEFDGYGGLISLQLSRCVGCHGAIFGRVRGAILMSDKTVINEASDPLLTDVTVGMVELALGAQYNWDMGCGVSFFARGTVEWQNWFNYTSAFAHVDDEDTFGAPSDVGFGGVAFSIGVAR